MKYYKIIRDGNAVDAGFNFLRWDTRHHCMMLCEQDKAQFVQSLDGSTVYRVPWLNPPPEDAPTFEEANVVIIGRQEYEDLIAVLQDGEVVPEPDPDPIPEPPQEPEPEPDQEEKPREMTVQEMRQKIKEQQLLIEDQNEQLAMLTECLLEMSEVVYG